MSYKVRITKTDGNKFSSEVAVTPYASDENAILLLLALVKHPKESWKKVQVVHVSQGRTRVVKTWPKDYVNEEKNEKGGVQ